MTELKTDAEKAEEIKAWWKENGKSVFAGVAVAIAGVFGWQQWQTHQKEQTLEAANLYYEISQAFAEDKTAILKDEFKSSPYASLAGLNAAKHYVESKNYTQAISELQWVTDNASDANLKATAQARLARLLIAENQLDEAIKLLDGSYPTSFNALISELKGDLALAKGEKSKAAEAYQKAISELDTGTPPRYLQMKLDNLGSGV